MAENHPNPREFTYTGSPDAWTGLIQMANYILTAAGVERDSGLVEAEWDSDFFGKRFLLTHRVADGHDRYGLRFNDQFASPDENGAYMGFQADVTHVDMLLDDAVATYGGSSGANTGYERAEIDLRSYLATHAMVAE